MAERRRPWLIPLFWLVAIGLGAALTLDSRHSIQPDGISYLDMGDAYWRGDWSTAINAFWSPLYPWIVGSVLFVTRPPAPWELTVVHFVNFGLFLAVLACFHFFMTQFVTHQRQALVGPSDQSWISLPGWAWWSLGYTLCIWSSLTLITVEVVTPDLLVAATLYLASGLLLRILEQPERWLNFGLLGVVLGSGYLAKAAMLPMAAVFVGTSLLAAGRPRLWLPRALVTLALVALIAVPFVTALSIARGRLTFGESYRFNYALHVNRTIWYVPWQGSFDNRGAAAHRARRLLDEPPLYEFDSPIRATYTPWYDPSYWYQDLQPQFHLAAQFGTALTALLAYYDLFLRSLGGVAVGCALLLSMAKRAPLRSRETIAKASVLAPAVAGLGMYGLIHVEPRYVGAYVVLSLLGLMLGLRLPAADWSGRLTRLGAVVMLVVLTVQLGVATALPASRALKDLARGQLVQQTAAVEVASGLHDLGLLPGDPVVWIGNGMTAYWARLAHLRIIAEVPESEIERFSHAYATLAPGVIEASSRTGAKAIVAQEWPAHVHDSGWQRLGETSYYAYLLADTGG